MNKGIALCNGEWLLFMNSGDTFYSKFVIENVFQNKFVNDCDVIYGNYQVLYSFNKIKVGKIGDVSKIWKGSQFCHQATFVKSNVHKLKKFDTDYKITADFSFFYDLYRNDSKFVFIPVFICNVLADGLSDRKRLSTIFQWFLHVEKSLPVYVFYFYRFLLETIKVFLKKILIFKYV
jgi:hypothetical protein